ncbi:unnamed protein product [Mesocestoides corti]|uniref:Uncharacterized protein n=1 Tax=Mesocestoides corti TaxID=53468 RepID=A0A0R3U8S5_MESCO|nr:unnamed protein product [Mesocestoides corti]
MEASKVLPGPPPIPEIDKYSKTPLDAKKSEIESIRRVRLSVCE